MKLRKTLLAFLLILSVLGTVRVPTLATPASEIQDQIDALERQAEEIAEDKKTLEEQIAANEEEILSFAQQKFQIDQEVELLRLDVENLNAQIHQYNLLIAQKQTELDALQQDLIGLSNRYELRMRAIQEQGEISRWSVIFRSDSFSDMLNRQAMTQEVAKADQRMMDELRAATAMVLDAKDVLGAKKTELERKKTELSDAEAALAAKRLEADAILAELAANKEAYAKDMEELEARENELSDQIAQKEKEYYDALNAGNQNGGGNGATMPPSESGFIFPLNPSGFVCITDAYGMRYHPTTGQYSMHNGVDFAAYQGTSIYASKSGIVTTAEEHYIWGNYVVINHGDGTSTLYAHMNYDTVSLGDYVTQGQTIGYVGSTGWSTGPHLHFTIYYNGSTVNPMNYVSTP